MSSQALQKATSKGDFNVSDLNDHCLMLILLQLPLRDLNSIGLTCHRFHDIVGTVYKYHKNFKTFDPTRMAKRYYRGDSFAHSVQQINGYLKAFGKLIEHIEFENPEIDRNTLATEFVNAVFSLIATFCADKFKSLKVPNIELSSESVAKSQRIFSNLTKIEIDRRNWARALPLCSNLETLIMRANLFNLPWNFNHQFPKLKTLEIELTGLSDFRYKHPPPLEPFIDRHPNLTRFSLHWTNISKIFNLAAIARLKYLEELILVDRIIHYSWEDYDNPGSPQDYKPLESLTKLRVLNISFYTRDSFSQFLHNSAAVNTLEHLTIRNCVINQQFVDGLSRFRNLKHLSIDAIDALPHANETAAWDVKWHRLRNLDSINELHFFWIMDPTTIYNMLENLVSNDLAINTLTLQYCYFDAKVFSNVLKFHNLQYLYLNLQGETSLIDTQFYQAITDTVDWPSLKQLNQIKVFSFRMGIPKLQYKPNLFLKNFLNNLGSRDTLQELSIYSAVVNGEIFQAIRNFPNLERIKFNGIKELEASHLTLIDNFKSITEFYINFFDVNDSVSWSERATEMARIYPTHEPYPWDQCLIDLVHRSPTLASLTFIHWDYIRVDRETPFKVEFYDELVDIVKNRIDSRKLVICVSPQIAPIPHYLNDFMFVEINEYNFSPLA